MGLCIKVDDGKGIGVEFPEGPPGLRTQRALLSSTYDVRKLFSFTLGRFGSHMMGDAGLIQSCPFGKTEVHMNRSWK